MITARANEGPIAGLCGTGLAAALLMAFGATPAQANDPQPEEIWQDQRVDEMYWDYAVSLGNNGSMVFSDTGLTSTYTRFYSAFRGSTSTPIWSQTLQGEASFARSVASARNADVHAVVRHQGMNTADRHATLEVFRSTQSAPVLSHTFAELDGGTGNNWCHVTDDGQTVFACALTGSSVHLKRFDANSSGQGFHAAGDWSFSARTSPRCVRLSDDFERIYVGSGSTGEVFDLTASPPQQVWFTWYLGGASLKGHSFSRDGNRIAVPVEDHIDVYDWNGSTYSLASSFAPFTSGRKGYVTALSEDATILTAGYYETPNRITADVLAWDLTTGEELLHDDLPGSAQISNVTNDIDISSDGSRVVAAFSGTIAGVVPGIRVYDRQPETGLFVETASFDRAGSVVEIELSQDGKRLAVAEKEIHTGTGTGDKIIETIDLGKDFDLRGIPRSGSTVTFEYYPQAPGPQTACLLLFSPYLSAGGPTELPFGRLSIDRNSISVRPMGSLDGEGKATKQVHVSGSLGSTVYYQGFATRPRQLSTDWVPMTILPQ